MSPALQVDSFAAEPQGQFTSVGSELAHCLLWHGWAQIQSVEGLNRIKSLASLSRKFSCSLQNHLHHWLLGCEPDIHNCMIQFLRINLLCTHTHTAYWFCFSGKPWPIWRQTGNFLFSTFKNRWIPSSGVWGLWEAIPHSYPEVPRKINKFLRLSGGYPALHHLFCSPRRGMPRPGSPAMLLKV